MSARTNLIMHLHCADCGAVLSLQYPGAEPNEPTLERYRSDLHDPEPTGALVRYIPAILVEPCRKCIEKHVGPARRLAEALADFRKGEKV